MEPENIQPDTSATWEKLIKPTYRAHLFDEVRTPLNQRGQKKACFEAAVVSPVISLLILLRHIYFRAAKLTGYIEMLSMCVPEHEPFPLINFALLL